MGTFITAKSGFSNIKSETVDVTVTRGKKIDKEDDMVVDKESKPESRREDSTG